MNSADFTAYPKENEVLLQDGLCMTVLEVDEEFTVNDTFTLSINPINDAPDITQLFSNIEASEDDQDVQFDLSEYFNDIDSNELVYSATEDVSSINIFIESNILTLSFIENLFDSGLISILASDGQLSVSASFEILVNPVNDAPIAFNIDVVTEEDNGIIIDLLAEDIDSDIFTASIVGQPSNGTVVLEDDLSIFYQPFGNYNGSDTIEYSIYDDDLEPSNIANISIVINPVNDAPILSDIADQSIDEDTSLTYSLVASDVDEDALTYSASIDGNGSVDVTDNLLTIIPTADYNGSILVTVNVSDGEYTDSDTFILTVNPVNDAPLITDAPIAETTEDNDVDIVLQGYDIDGDDLVFLLDQDSADGFVDINGNTATFSPDENFNGVTTFTYQVSDGQLTSSSSTVSITVTPVNDAPIANTTSAITNEDQSIDISLSGSDIDGDNLTFNLDSNATNGSVNIENSIATYTPNQDFNGSDSFIFSVSDGYLSDEASVTLTVNTVNDAPILSDIEDQSIDEDSSLTYSLLASDVDEDALTYSASVDGNATVDVIDNLLTIISTADYNGSITVTVNVSDGEYTDSDTFTLTVNPVNDAPILSDIADQSIDEESRLR